MKLTTAEARIILEHTAEDAEWSYDDACALFEALYDRRPNDSDGDTGNIISHCYAAMPSCREEWDDDSDDGRRSDADGRL